VKQKVEALLRPHPALRALLAQRLACVDADVVGELFRQRGAEVVSLVLILELSALSAAASTADRAALRALLLTVLPYASDLREQVAASDVESRGERAAVPLSYRTGTIAEVVMAGAVGRDCAFELVGDEPRGVGAVAMPAMAQTALFTSAAHLRAGVVEQLAGRLMTTGTTLAEKTQDVRDGLAREAELGRMFGNSREHPVRYYLPFRDADHPDVAEAKWQLVIDALHGPDGLPGLVLVRLNGGHRPEETKLQRDLVDLLKRQS
jgi:hypothetical protein